MFSTSPLSLLLDCHAAITSPVALALVGTQIRGPLVTQLPDLGYVDPTPSNHPLVCPRCPMSCDPAPKKNSQGPMRALEPSTRAIFLETKDVASRRGRAPASDATRPHGLRVPVRNIKTEFVCPVLPLVHRFCRLAGRGLQTACREHLMYLPRQAVVRQ